MTSDQLTRTGPAVTQTDADRASADAPTWLAERRATAWRAYETMDFPDLNDEEWRRTDVRAINLEGIRPVADATRANGATPIIPADATQFTGRVEQHNAAVVATTLTDDLKTKGVIFTDLQSAARDHADLVQRYFGTAIAADEWKYVALNAALWTGGCFLYVPKDVEVELPLLYLQKISPESGAAFPRTLIVAERNSKVTFVDETASDGDAKSFVSAATEIFIGDGAKVEYYSVNGWGAGVYNFNTVRATVGRDASFVGMAAGIGSKLTKMRIDAEMPESGASTKLLGVTFGSADQHFDYNTLQNHTGKHTISDLQFKSALTDSSSLVWYGITRINETAGGSEANQTSRNLLLSEKAKAAPIPILEIKAHDVAKCSHGATAGPVDEDHLFYLEARAIPRRVAEQMLVEGFFADVIDRMPNTALRERVMLAVMAKIGGGVETTSFEDLIEA